ncbi:hypothetical protein B7P43_G08354 [Cryptotermes secundus]|uniref:Methyltransferase type 11 domain-containing protein n=1 Tax=Cryptotermes secundus TaxID=105785 RepID=A0A2J7PEJ2_9NEOP|nr:uncharacterized protein LOC111874479 isoform X2 [Cryptotermes secundus]PNF14742.1 hypothetical protein B7P43_G08354 [Cryptotermes secundus]PNF14745.1 hypothetical protein B7P43_G08354 [Cryptotermes secundus]
MSCDSSEKLSLPEAQEGFLNIVRKLNNSDNLKQFLDWIQWNWLNDCNLKDTETSEEILDAIASDLRSSLPPEAILPSETIRPPAFGKNSDCTQEHTVHVDEFLYDNATVDALCDEGKLARNYCLQCGSFSTRPLTFISHSLSREKLLLIFKSVLPPLDNKIVLDIGSRLGAALFGDRIEIIEGNIAHRPDVILSADVIIMNNVFEFFMEPEQQTSMWRFLRQTIKSGTLLVTIPSLEETFSSLQTGIILSEWVQELPSYNPDAAGITLSADEMLEVKQYQIM